MFSPKFVKLLIVSFICTVAVFTFPKVKQAFTDKPVQRAFTGHEDHSYTLQDAQKLVYNFQKDAPANSELAYFFGRDAVLKVLFQEKCTGIRLYNAKHNDGTTSLVGVGVDENGADMTKGIVIQKTFPCPPFCDSSDVMNKYQSPIAFSNRVK
jgi:hypothetical protein